MRRLLLALVLLLGCGPEAEGGSVNPSRDLTRGLTMPPCHTALATWHGTEARSNGVDTGTGNSCGGWGVHGLEYQCVELVMRHFQTTWGTSWYGNAKDLLANAPRVAIAVYWNGDRTHPPVAGDMLVWTQGTWGHVALVTRVGGGTIDVIEQNVAGNGRATFTYVGGTVGGRWGTWTPAGWAHAKANTTRHLQVVPHTGHKPGEVAE
jgi:hypothetical protein